MASRGMIEITKEEFENLDYQGVSKRLPTGAVIRLFGWPDPKKIKYFAEYSIDLA